MMKVLAMLFLWGLSAPVFALDYADDEAVCSAIEANKAQGTEDSKENFKATCSCRLKIFQNALEPEKYGDAVEWMIDAEAFAETLPKGFQSLTFMSEILLLDIESKKSCE